MWLQVEKVVVREWFEALVEKVSADCSRFQLRESEADHVHKGVPRSRVRAPGGRRPLFDEPHVSLGPHRRKGNPSLPASRL